MACFCLQAVLAICSFRRAGCQPHDVLRVGANPMTFLGLSGVGDLFVTCTSPLSRNFQVGYALGEGLELEAAVAKVGQVAEGINTTRIIKEEAEQLGIYMPLVSALYETMFNQRPVSEVLSSLMFYS